MIEAPKIILVEDDFLQSELAVEAFSSLMPEAQITLFETEAQFRRGFREITGNPPYIFVVDILLPWDHLGEETMRKPANVIALGDDSFRTAGIRIHDLILRNPVTENVPVLLWTMIDLFNPDATGGIRFANDSLEGSLYLPKSFPMTSLVDDVRSILSGQTPQNSFVLPKYAPQSLTTPA